MWVLALWGCIQTGSGWSVVLFLGMLKDRLRLDELLQVLVYIFTVAFPLGLLKDRLRLDELLQVLVYLL